MPNIKRSKSLVGGLPFYVCLILLAYMPFHVFITQYLSLATGGLQAWKIAKDVFVALTTVFVICLVWQQGKLTKQLQRLLILTATYGLLHVTIWAAHPHIYKTSAILGLTYNLRLPCFAIIGYGAYLLRPDLFKWSRIIKWVLTISSIVAALGVIQYFLPSDLLTHFGYSVARGARPNFFIDNNPAFPRIMSTLRDPNSLAAYLIVPISLLTVFVIRSRESSKRWLYDGLLVLHGLAFWLTYSRSALLALLVALTTLVAWENYARFKAVLRRAWPLAIGLTIVLIVAGVFAVRHNSQLNGVVTHATTQQVGQYDSNQFHWLFVKRGLQGIRHDPFGHGPGTAGLASIQNPHGGLLTENYYVQVGYEVGVVGLVLFLALNYLILYQLWTLKSYVRVGTEKSKTNDAEINLQTMLVRILFVSAIAYFIMNMLLHTWSNEAVACQWWLLAGLVFASTKMVRS